MSQGTRQAAGRLPGDSPRCFLASSSPVVCMCPGFTATKKTRPQIKGSYLWIEWNTHCSRVEQAWVFLYVYMHTALRHFQFGFVCRLLATGKPQPDLLHYVCAATTSIDSNLPHVSVAIKKLLNEVWTSAVSVKKKGLRCFGRITRRWIVCPVVVQMQHNFFKKSDHCGYWSCRTAALEWTGIHHILMCFRA
jgi:hypothetical protein